MASQHNTADQDQLAMKSKSDELLEDEQDEELHPEAVADHPAAERRNAATPATSTKSSKASSRQDADQDAESGDHSQAQQLESLMELLQRDLQDLDQEAAVASIDDWYANLHKSKDADLKALAGSLKELKKDLQGNKASAHDLSEILSQVGEQTQDLAAEADRGLKSKLNKLGKQLTKMGTAVLKAEEQEQQELVDQLLEQLDNDPGDIDTEAANQALDQWYNLLNKAESEEHKAIAANLKRLKQLLKGSRTRPADLQELLQNLSEQTTAAAAELGRGLKGPVGRLGKYLSKLARSLDAES